MSSCAGARRHTAALTMLAMGLTASALGLALANESDAAEVRAAMAVTAVIVDSVTIQVEPGAPRFIITARDIRAGYVDVTAGPRVTTKAPLLVELRPTSEIVRSVTAHPQGRPAEFDSDGATRLYIGAAGAAGGAHLQYRIKLAPGLRPGTHDWPVSITLLPM